MTPILVGLFVAIPAYWFYHHLSTQLETFAVEMDHATSQLVNQLICYLQKTPLPRPQLDATLVLHRTSIVIFVYAILTTLAYLLSDCPWTALVALVFFTGAGIGLRFGSYLAAASLLAYSSVTSFAACVSDEWSFRTVTLAALPLFLIPWWKARRP